MRILSLSTLLFILHFSVSGQHKYSCSSDEDAFGGYDLVSYFGESPIKGTIDYTYDGLNLKFSSKENLALFKKDPEAYLPQYGGWCATAITTDIYVNPNYSMYTIQNDKLLFFEVKAFFNGKTQWEKNPEANQLVAERKYNEKFKD